MEMHAYSEDYLLTAQRILGDMLDYAVNEEWAEAMGIESVVIDENTDIRILKNELRWNEVVYR